MFSVKIAFFEINDWEKKNLQQNLAGHDLFFFDEPLNSENVHKASSADVISVFIYSVLDEPVLEKLQNLKMVATRSTGFDHIDIEYCNKNSISVSNVPTYGENTVAEHTFALILSLSRNIHKSYVRSLRDDFSTDGLKGFDLKGKTIGVVGAGKIGLHVIRMAKGFGMNVLAFDVTHNNFLEEILGYEYVGFNELLQSSDIICLCVPYNKHTYHLININNISDIKRGALLINTSRGAVVETDALLKALNEGILSGAGLDVIEGENLIKEEKEILHDPNKSEELKILAKDQEILKKENVVYTPHIAFYSQEALERIIKTTIENIKSLEDTIGKNPKNVVNQ